MDFILLAENTIRGDQLVEEIKLATSIDTTDRCAFYAPNLEGSE